MRPRWLVMALSAAALAVALPACGKSSTGANAAISGSTLTVYSSLPEQGGTGDRAKAIENGIRIALANRAGKVGKYTIAYKPLDDSLASTGAADQGKGGQNARTAAQDKTTIGYIGEYNSGISTVTIRILNDAGIAQVSPTNTYVGLTSNAPGSEPGEPGRYYPTGKRTYVRVVPKDTVQAAALVTATKQDGCTTVAVFNSKSTDSAGLARDIRLAAPKAGVKIVANDAYEPKAANYRSLMSKVHAACAIQTGEIEQNGVQVMKDFEQANPGAKLYGSDGICLNAVADPKKGLPASLASNYHCSIATPDPKSLGPAGKRFLAAYKARYHQPQPDPYALYGYESMSLLLDAIQRAQASGSLTREKVVDELFATRNRDSALGLYSIDRNGDSTITAYGLYKITGKAVSFDRVIKPNRSLIAG
ncbi:MAG: branched-chain amino acid ABC transporter substrate-binding protein [Actinobacteria bacterium]|nr:branched-chain amino acid ABC transporter substrate-binding protein [Actinomycetota bacterium]